MTISDSERRFIMTDGATPTKERLKFYGIKENDRCPNSWFGSHKFKPRYDTRPDLTGLTHIRGTGAIKFVDRLRKQTYVRDVCVKCGKTIERA